MIDFKGAREWNGKETFVHIEGLSQEALSVGRLRGVVEVPMEKVLVVKELKVVPDHRTSPVRLSQTEPIEAQDWLERKRDT